MFLDDTTAAVTSCQLPILFVEVRLDFPSHPGFLIHTHPAALSVYPTTPRQYHHQLATCDGPFKAEDLIPLSPDGHPAPASRADI
jgi:hypothetical protein